MMLTNLTGEGNNKTIEQQYCSPELSENVHTYLIFLSMINIFLSITAFLGNTLTLVALRKECSLHPPSKLLYRNLAITDLCVGIIMEPIAVTYWISQTMQRSDICQYTIYLTYVTGHVLFLLSLLTITAISIGRLFALLLGLRYRQVVTLKRTYVVITIWAISIVSGAIYNVNSLVAFWWWNIVKSLLCLVTSTLSYTKMFLTLRQNQIQPQENIFKPQSTQATPLNMARYRKAASSALWVQVTLVVCYLPYFVALVLTPHGELPFPTYLARQFAVTILFLNSSLNPLLYCWKIKEVRQAVKETLTQVSCSFV